MGALLKFEAEYAGIECCACGIGFHVPALWQASRRADGQSFYCPNGHGQAYQETDVQRLNKELEQERTRVAFYRREAEQQKATAEKAMQSLARTKKRVGTGVCPCCKRSFTGLRLHMARKHPDYTGVRM